MSEEIEKIQEAQQEPKEETKEPKEAKKEVYEGMTSEQMTAEYFDTDALVAQPMPVYRLDSRGHRYYYTIGEDGEPTFYTSVTTFIRQTMPTDPQLVKWIADMGYEESKAFTADRAHYGTFLHIQIGELLISKSYDLDMLKDKLLKYMEGEQLPYSFISNAEDLKRDMLSFAQFAKDVHLKPLAIEVVLTNPEDHYAGAIDLVAEMTTEEKGFFGEVYKSGAKKGQPKETKKKTTFMAIIDFKSGKKGFYPEYEIQLHAYRKMWNLNFPDKQVERLFNWSPKDWRGKTPTYNLKEQTNSKNAEKLPFLVELAKIEDAKRNNTLVYCGGTIELEKDLNDNISEITLSDAIKQLSADNEFEEEK